MSRPSPTWWRRSGPPPGGHGPPRGRGRPPGTRPPASRPPRSRPRRPRASPASPSGQSASSHRPSWCSAAAPMLPSARVAGGRQAARRRPAADPPARRPGRLDQRPPQVDVGAGHLGQVAHPRDLARLVEGGHRLVRPSAASTRPSTCSAWPSSTTSSTALAREMASSAPTNLPPGTGPPGPGRGNGPGPPGPGPRSAATAGPGPRPARTPPGPRRPARRRYEHPGPALVQQPGPHRVRVDLRGGQRLVHEGQRPLDGTGPAGGVGGPGQRVPRSQPAAASGSEARSHRRMLHSR